MYWYLRCWKLAFFLNGRARRKEYWTFALINFIIYLLFYILSSSMMYKSSDVAFLATSISYFLYTVATILPGIAVAVRRLHDTGRSGWWYLLIFIPLIGSIWLIVLLCLDSEPGENQWGENPKGIEAEEAA